MWRIYFIWSRIGVYFSNREGNLISTCHIKPFKNLLHAVSRWRKRLSTHTKTTDAEKEKSYRKWVRSRFGSRGSDARANVSVLLAVAQQQQQTFPTQSSNRVGLFRQAGWRKASDQVCWGRFLPGRSEEFSWRSYRAWTRLLGLNSGSVKSDRAGRRSVNTRRECKCAVGRFCSAHTAKIEFSSFAVFMIIQVQTK